MDLTTSLVQTQPATARRLLLELLRVEQGSTKAVAAACGVTQRTVCRWIASLDLRARVDLLQAKMNVRGLRGPGIRRGRPRKAPSSLE